MPDYLRSPAFWIVPVACACATGALTPVVMRLARAAGAVDRGGYRRVYEGTMPLLGGLGIILPFLAVCLLGVFGAAGVFVDIDSEFRLHFVVLTAGSVAITALGVFDDVRGLRAREKLLGQTVVALAVATALPSPPWIDVLFLGAIPLERGIAILIGTAWIVGLINGFNLVDGLDGLAAGIGWIACVALAAVAAIDGNTFVVLACAALVGSLPPFLAFNFHPARVFLGNTGSMFLGYVLATMALTGVFRAESTVVVLTPLLVLALPIFEPLITIVRRYARGAPIFAGDNHHTHHRLLRAGHSQRRVVPILCGAGVLLATGGVAHHLAPAGSVWGWAAVALNLGTVGGIAWLAGYIRHRTLDRVLDRRRRNAVLGALSRYAIGSLSASPGRAVPDRVARICCDELGLVFLEASFETGETLIASNGAPSNPAGAHPRSDPAEQRLRVASLGGEGVIVRFEYGHVPDEEERVDVAACLARVFEQSRFRGPRLNPP